MVAWGTGALNIAATRVATDWSDRPDSWKRSGHSAKPDAEKIAAPAGIGITTHPGGRWPSNVVLTHAETCQPVGTRKVRSNAQRATDAAGEWHGSALAGSVDGSLNGVRASGYGDADGTETVEAWECAAGCPVAELDAQSGVGRSPAPYARGAATAPGVYEGRLGSYAEGRQTVNYGDEGGASRFFHVFRYQAKAPTRERPKVDGVAHPTCKPLALIRWMARLITPPGGTILDPFAGSGTTAEAAILEGFRCITIEREAEYLPLILARIQRQEPVEAPPARPEQLVLLDDDPAA